MISAESSLMQILFGVGKALGEGEIVWPEGEEALEVEGGGEPLGLAFAVPGLELVPVGDVLGRDRKCRRAVGVELLPDGFDRSGRWLGVCGDGIARKPAGQGLQSR